MKKDNNLIRITNSETGEVKYFTKDTYVQNYIGCTQASLPSIKAGTSKKFTAYKYDIVEGSEIKWKDINEITQISYLL